MSSISAYSSISSRAHAYSSIPRLTPPPSFKNTKSTVRFKEVAQPVFQRMNEAYDGVHYFSKPNCGDQGTITEDCWQALPIPLRHEIWQYIRAENIKDLSLNLRTKQLGILEETADCWYESLMLRAIHEGLFDLKDASGELLMAKTQRAIEEAGQREVMPENRLKYLLLRPFRRGVSMLLDRMYHHLPLQQATLNGPTERLKAKIQKWYEGTLYYTYDKLFSGIQNYPEMLRQVESYFQPKDIQRFADLYQDSPEEARHLLALSYIRLASLRIDGLFQDLLTSTQRQLASEYDELKENLLKQNPAPNIEDYLPLHQILDPTVPLSDIQAGAIRVLHGVLHKPNLDSQAIRQFIMIKHRLRQGVHLLYLNDKKIQSPDRKKNTKPFEGLVESCIIQGTY